MGSPPEEQEELNRLNTLPPWAAHIKSLRFYRRILTGPGTGLSLARLKEPCLDFIDTLWTAAGGFHGTWDDEELDLEYTYYGLLALGHLSM